MSLAIDAIWRTGKYLGNAHGYDQGYTFSAPAGEVLPATVRLDVLEIKSAIGPSHLCD
jgi:hypothetical protein